MRIAIGNLCFNSRDVSRFLTVTVFVFWVMCDRGCRRLHAVQMTIWQVVRNNGDTDGPAIRYPPEV